MSSILRPSPSPSAGEEGWSTGDESSYYSSSWETFEDMAPDTAGMEEPENALQWSYRGGGEEKEIEEDALSYDAIEDGSEWISDSEKIARDSGHILTMPTIEDESSDDESSTWRFEVSSSTTNPQHPIASRDENTAGRLESNSVRDGFDSENPLSSKYTKNNPAASSTVKPGGPSTTRSSRKVKQSKQDNYDSESRASTSGASDREPNIPRDGSKSTQQEKSTSSSNLFALSSSSMQSSESPRGEPQGGTTSSSSTSESNLRSESHGRRRRRQTRSSKKSSSPATKKASAPFRPIANESNLRISESTGSQTEPSSSKTSRQKRSHSNPVTNPKPKSSTRRSSSDRRIASQKVSSSSASRSRKGIHNAPNIPVGRHQKSQNNKTTSVGSKTSTLNSSDFRGSISFLRDCDCGLRTTTKRIHATINNEGYKNFVRSAYYKLLEARPRLKYLLSLSEWLHVHMLLLYARIFDCELHFYGITLPREFRIAIPDNIMVFEPIATVISSIGIVDEADIGITYIPVARSYRGTDVYKAHNKDDVTEFLEWNQYDWNASWYQVEGARLERRIMAASKNINIPTPEVKFDDSKLEEWQQLAVEKWLGWDDDLWFSYSQACYVLGRCGHFVSIPSDCSKDGSFAWLLPRHHNSDTGAFVRIPRPNLHQECWMIALMVGMCALEDTDTSTWYHETNSVENVQVLIESFIDSGMTAN